MYILVFHKVHYHIQLKFKITYDVISKTMMTYDAWQIVVVAAKTKVTLIILYISIYIKLYHKK